MSPTEWLASLGLRKEYAETFELNFFTSMERICDIWDDELTSILGESFHLFTTSSCHCALLFTDEKLPKKRRLSWLNERKSCFSDLEKVGHRKRILLSVAGAKDYQSRFGKVQTEETRPRHKVVVSYMALPFILVELGKVFTLNNQIITRLRSFRILQSPRTTSRQ